ncbi:Uncharacterised protein [Mycobacteroides abscessus]|nr:Uncharacterised protein [Mycobacteroides abscessus]
MDRAVRCDHRVDELGVGELGAHVRDVDDRRLLEDGSGHVQVGTRGVGPARRREVLVAVLAARADTAGVVGAHRVSSPVVVPSATVPVVVPVARVARELPDAVATAGEPGRAPSSDPLRVTACAARRAAT